MAASDNPDCEETVGARKAMTKACLPRPRIALALFVVNVLVLATGCEGNDGSLAGGGPERVTIATFNIQVFGESKRLKPSVMGILADIADEFDVIAIQEIRDVSGETPGAFLSAMNAQGGEAHDMVVSERLGRTTSKEQYAIYYDQLVVDVVGAPATYPDAGDVFEREPFGARFHAAGFDFVLLNVHIKPDDALAEISALNDVVVWAVDRFQDEDVVILGDFNADCSYLSEEIREAVLPLNWITPTDFDTTVAGTVCTYDNIVLSESLMDEFTGAVEVFRFDAEYGLVGELTEDVSDHYPVWASFSASM